MDAALRRALKGGGDGTGDDSDSVNGEAAGCAFGKARIMKRTVRLFRDETVKARKQIRLCVLPEQRCVRRRFKMRRNCCGMNENAPLGFGNGGI